jgi:hypothetical protein
MRRVTFFKDQGGYTCVEMLLASSILAPVVISLLLMLETLQGSYAKGERRADLQQSARIAMTRIARDLRTAGLDPSAVIPHLATATAIQTAETDRIAFVGDIDGDGNTEKVEFRLDLSTSRPVLRRQQWSTWTGSWSGSNGAQPLAEGITGVEFTYIGASGSAIPSNEITTRLAEIRRVGIVILAASQLDQMPAEYYRLVSEVRIRNTGL